MCLSRVLAARQYISSSRGLEYVFRPAALLHQKVRIRKAIDHVSCGTATAHLDRTNCVTRLRAGGATSRAKHSCQIWAEATQLERDRVRLCALKLARGDLRELECQISIANTDFRDVVGAAEYPAQLKIGFSAIDKLDAGERAMIVEEDRKQIFRMASRVGNPNHYKMRTAIRIRVSYWLNSSRTIRHPGHRR